MLSLEISRTELMNRFFSAQAGVELTRLNRHELTQDDWRRVHNATRDAGGWPLAVSDASTIGLTGVTAHDRLRIKRGLAVLVMDYLQLVTPADARVPRQEQVAGVSCGLKLLARDLDIAVVAAAQVNRVSDARAGGRPTMNDLRESGAIEADADTILLLHDDPEQMGELELIVAKNRHGPKRNVNLAWAPHYARVGNLSRERAPI